MTTVTEASQRHWQNWDNGEAATRIDAYWISTESGWRDMLVDDIQSVFDKKTSLLEVGCGSGLIYQHLRNRRIVTSNSYQGGDISKNMLSIARQRFPNVTFKEMDIFELPLETGSQPSVINIHVIQHLPHYEQAVSELIRITSKKLYIVSWFSTKPEDELNFSDPSPDWDGQAFQNNCYSLSKFLTFIITHSNKDIQEIRVHHFGGQSYSICVIFGKASDTTSIIGKAKRMVSRLTCGGS